eukprot:776020_1
MEFVQDIFKKIDTGDFSFRKFKEIWVSMDLNYIHLIKPKNESTEEFMNELYGVFTDKILSSPSNMPEMVWSVYALYILYQSQHVVDCKPVKIILTSDVWNIILRITTEFTQLRQSDPADILKLMYRKGMFIFAHSHPQTITSELIPDVRRRIRDSGHESLADCDADDLNSIDIDSLETFGSRYDEALNESLGESSKSAESSAASSIRSMYNKVGSLLTDHTIYLSKRRERMDARHMHPASRGSRSSGPNQSNSAIRPPALNPLRVAAHQYRIACGIKDEPVQGVVNQSITSFLRSDVPEEIEMSDEFDSPPLASSAGFLPGGPLVLPLPPLGDAVKYIMP